VRFPRVRFPGPSLGTSADLVESGLCQALLESQKRRNVDLEAARRSILAVAAGFGAVCGAASSPIALAASLTGSYCLFPSAGRRRTFLQIEPSSSQATGNNNFGALGLDAARRVWHERRLTSLSPDGFDGRRRGNS
jgi:hypothetical protein